jgi:signal transduction histidine kinase
MLVGLMIFEMYLWWVVRSFVEISFIAGIALSLPAAGVLVVEGYRLPRTPVTERHYPRLLAWTAAGAVVLGGFSVITGVAFFPEMPWAQVGSVRSGVSVGGGTGFLIGFLIARGVEQRVAAERAAVQAEEAEDRREMLEYLNALLRHEVLNTTQAITGHVTLLESKLDENERRLEHTEVIRRQAEEVTSVINDVQLLLEASEEPDLEPVHLRPILENELRNVRDRNGAVETELDAPSEMQVIADDLVRRVFSNLLRNAVEHNDSEQKRVSVSVTETDETITVEIEDNGPGIPKDEREGIFDLEIKKQATHGLGLTIVARLLDRYGGDVDLIETGPEGTVFAVTLSSAESKTENRATEAETHPENRTVKTGTHPNNQTVKTETHPGSRSGGRRQGP